MTTEPADKKIKPKEEDDDSLKKVFSRLSIPKWTEWHTETSDEKLMEKEVIRFFCCYDYGDFNILYIKFPDTFREFYQQIFDRCHAYRFTLRYKDHNDIELLIQYYDETEYNCIDLNDESWLEFRKYIISSLQSRRLSYLHYPYPVIRVIITAVPKGSVSSSNKFIGYRRARYESRHLKGQKSLSDRLNELTTSSLLVKDWMMEEPISWPTHSKWLMETDPFEGGDTSSSSEKDDVKKLAVSVKDTETSITSYVQLVKRTRHLNFLKTEYSFIYLLTEADVSDELKYISREARIFVKPYECLSEVVKAIGQKLIIIGSQSLLKHFVPLIHDLIQVIYIYIIHKYDSYHENEDDNYVNDKRYPKVRGSFVEQNMLITKLNDDLQQLTNIPLRQPIFINSSKMKTNIEFYVISKQPSSLKLVTAEEKDFMLFQLIITTILESGSVNPLNNLSTSLDLCRIFPNESKDLWKIDDEFNKNYVSEKAIHFYLSNASLKNELNMCFSNKNIQKICKLWFFIRDLLKQLPGSKKSITVYRGQYLTTDQIQILKNNIGSFMTFTKFFSMSTSNIRAIRRSEEDDSNKKLKSVVFQLQINNGNTSTRFSMIKQTYEEQIFLFAAGNIFRIESVEELNDTIWCCKLTINNDVKSELTRMFKYYETEIGTSLTYLSLGVYLNEIGEENLARQYYETLLVVTTDSDIKFTIYNNLAIIFERKNDLTNAQKYWDLASKLKPVNTLKTSTLLSNQESDVVVANPISDTSPILNYYNLACVYQQAKYFDEALEECEKALKLSTTTSDPTHIALVHSAMGSTYYSQNKYEDALKSFQMALDIALIHLLATDPLIDQYLNNVRLLKNKIDEKS